MINKKFSERLNKELDNIGVPEATIERIQILSKLIRIPKFKAEALLSGSNSPDAALLKIIAQELEVSENWLLGKDDSKTH
jgi:transcriptional regulator with XRE-family HTH domain